MVQDATLHLKIDKKTDESLKRIAYASGKSKGQIVREAISVCYQTSLVELPLRQKQALEAYQGGFISVGKLSVVMGMHVLELRRWLDEHGLAQPSAYGDEDAANA